MTVVASPSPSKPRRFSIDDGAEFDYVIVGSGAGGAPLAAQLAEYGHQVLVLEAGPDHSACPSVSTQVPGYHGPSTEDPDVSWRFFVDHYTSPRQADPKRDPRGRGIFYPRATGIGGCTIHNALITIAGPASDWDELAWYLNDPSWAADVMRGYFRELECCDYLDPRVRARKFWQGAVETFWWLLGRDDDPTVGRHGFAGWLHTSFADPKLGLGDPQLVAMLTAALKVSAAAGLEAPSRSAKRVLLGETWEELDPNHFRRQAERPEGVVLVPSAVYGAKHGMPDRGRRSSPARRLLDVELTCPNLTIATDCLATEVLLSKDGGHGDWRATGLKYVEGARLYRAHKAYDNANHRPIVAPPKIVRARREVILCGGTFNTPQLLMLSGIGPREHLRSRDIEVKIDSPGVGRNLQDRYEVTVIAEMPAPFRLLKGSLFDPTTPDANFNQWKTKGEGLYTSNGAVLGIFKRSSPELEKPDLFIFGIPLKFKGYEEGYSRVQPNEFNQFTWAILKAHTRNNGGSVELASPDPLDTPKINFRYFGSTDHSPPRKDDPDLKAVLGGVKFVRRILTQVSAKEIHPNGEAKTDDEIEKWIEKVAWGHHACGTCRMGRVTDPMAVIDSRFRVLGEADANDPRRRRRRVNGLRVVDASIFPNIPGYFIVSNIYMASEKAADVIHAEHEQAAAAAVHRSGPHKAGGGSP